MISLSPTHKIFEFSIKDTAASEMLTYISWSLDTGIETINSTYTFNLTPNNFSYVFVEYNYTTRGDYSVIASASSDPYQDSETIAIEIPDI